MLYNKFKVIQSKIEHTKQRCGDNATRLPPSHCIRMNPHKLLCFEIVEQGYFSALIEPYKTVEIELCTVLYKHGIAKQFFF